METFAVGFLLGVIVVKIHHKKEIQKIKSLREENRDLKKRVENLRLWANKVMRMKTQSAPREKKMEKNESIQ